MPRTIKDKFDLNEALFSGVRHFSLAGPRGGGKIGKLRYMVRDVYGETTLPLSKERDGSYVELVEQIRSGATTAGTTAQFGFVVVDVNKQHFDEVTQANWHDADHVQFAFEKLIAETLRDYYSYASINRKLAVVFNFDNAPFAPDSVQFKAVERTSF
ncbi:MAG: hypothetical protein OSB62_01150 [Alphaproteobacteria bacterium]|nr:hypothetical protein [Alphaproteobacteria bacterium]